MVQLLTSPVIFAFVVFDMTFMPMFHIGGIHGIPYKLCYLILILFFALFVYERRKVFGIKLWRQLSVLFLLVILLSWIGGFRHNLYFGEATYSETIRNTLICLLVPMGLLYGMSQKRENLNFIIPFIFIYLFLNIMITFFFADLQWMLKFYYLEGRVEEGLFFIRSPGLFYNPNVSSLVMNILYLSFVVGLRNKCITYKSKSIYPMIIITVFSLHFLTASRSEFIAAILITSFLIYYMVENEIGFNNKMASILRLISITAVILIAFFSIFLGQLVERYSVVEIGIDSIASSFTAEKFLDKNTPDNSLFRPLSKTDLVLKRFFFSPIFGSGFDGSPTSPGGLRYHNDWFDILVATGIIGFFLYLLIVRFSIVNAGLVMVVPFLLPALTNSFMYAPQSFVLYFVILGYAIRMNALNKNGLLQSKK